jgi:hypothetical protein
MKVGYERRKPIVTKGPTFWNRQGRGDNAAKKKRRDRRRKSEAEFATALEKLEQHKKGNQP